MVKNYNSCSFIFCFTPEYESYFTIKTIQSFKIFHHKIQNVSDLQGKAFWKRFENKDKNVGNAAFLPFSTIFPTLLKTKFIIWATFNLSCADAFILVKSICCCLVKIWSRENFVTSHVDGSWPCRWFVAMW